MHTCKYIHIPKLYLFIFIYLYFYREQANVHNIGFCLIILAFIFFKAKMQSKQTRYLSSVSRIENIITDLYIIL